MTKLSMPAFGRPSAPAPRTAPSVSKTAFLLLFTDIEKEVSVIKLEGEMKIGREIPGSKPDIAIDSPIVSRDHGVIKCAPDGYYYTDNDSFNGTFINGILYKKDVNPCSAPIRLNDGDVLRIDSVDPKKSHKNAVTAVFATTYDKRSKWRRVKIKTASVQIGFSAKNLLEFARDKIASRTAEGAINEIGFNVRNVSGRPNMWHNNRAVAATEFIRNKDVFRINENYIYFDRGEFIYNVCLVTEPGMEVRLAETFVPDKMKKKVLLKDINMNIDKGDFALIIGGSGAGKSTFMNSILGKYDIVGNIKIGGRLTSGSADVTSGIAYVPQTLPIRKEERLIDVVTDTCVLRCKRKMTKAQRKQFIMDSLDAVGLKSKAEMEIKKLSGGEQRRAAIANEVVTDADIFFLDEPDSGLDPKSGMELMNNLKALSDVGKMVMLISHNYASYPSPERIYTKIIILAKSNKDGIGRLAFCGSVPEALEFFGVEALKDITKLINPVSENGDGRADEFVDKFRRMNVYG